MFQMLEARYPAESDIARLNRGWAKKPINDVDADKQKELSIIMRGLVKENRERKRTNKDALDWLPEYVDQFIEIMGRKEADRIVRSLAHGAMKTDTEDRFTQLVGKALR